MASSAFAGYLFAYFTGEGTEDGEQVRFARSKGNDALNWQELSGGRPWFRSTLGTRGVRDPFLIRAAGLPGEKAKFYLIATDLWVYAGDPETVWQDVQVNGSRGILVWESQDLVTWTDERLVTVAPPDAGNAWAPEATFDPETGEYFVYWASQLLGPANADSFGMPYNRMFSARTRDFRTFSRAEVWLDPGHSVIDSTVAREGDLFHRITKDERTADPQLGAQFLTAEYASTLDSRDYVLIGDGIGRPTGNEPAGVPGLQRGEGPILIRSNDGAGWYLFIDEFLLRGYVPFFAETLATTDWRMCADYRLPPSARHGSILSITRAEWDAFDSFAG